MPGGCGVTYVIACLMAAASFLLNRLLLRLLGARVIIGYGPAVEEAAKTLLSYWLGADIILTHVTFGLIEGVYDWFVSQSDGFKAALMSILGHTLFGLITVAAAILFASIWLGLASGILVHIMYNVTIVRLYAG